MKEKFFKDDNNTPTTKQELDETRLTFLVTFVALGVWAVINFKDLYLSIYY
jgi:hypothetical protein